MSWKFAPALEFAPIHPRWMACLFVLAAVIGCSDDDSGDPVADGQPDSLTEADTQVEPDGSAPEEDVAVLEPIDVPGIEEGTFVLFDWQADLESPESFYDLPTPFDFRLAADGTQSLEGLPRPDGAALVAPFRELAATKVGTSTLSPGYFRLSAPTAPIDTMTLFEASVDSPLLLVEVDPESPHRGRLIPTVASTLEPDDWTPENLLAVAAYPGFVMSAGRQYAYVVMRDLGDEDGAPLGVSAGFASALGGPGMDDLDPEVAADFAIVWETLDALGIDRVDVAAATVFTTADVVAELAALSEAARGAFTVEVQNLEVDPDDGADHDRFCELRGTITLPQFQSGTSPYDTGGLFGEVGPNGVLPKFRDETAPIAITLPKNTGPMPAGGYPLMFYFHGSGGLSSQMVDRGPFMASTGGVAKGEGPAYVVAEHGFAGATMALQVNPERVPGAGETAYINPNNLVAMRDTFRQGIIEAQMFFDALEGLVIPPEVVAACDGLELPAGAEGFRVDATSIYAMGTSMGGMYTNMSSAVDARIKASVPAAAGGYWTYFILDSPLLSAGFDLGPLLGPFVFGTDAELSVLHPAMALVQSVYEFVDPIVYAPRLSLRPLEGHEPRGIYQPVGLGDEYFQEEVYDAMSIAYGHEQVGPMVWPSLLDGLELAGIQTNLSYPVASNLSAEGGAPYTGAVIQWTGDILNSHYIVVQRDDVKYQYGCLFRSHLDTGVAVIPEPAPLGTPCPTR